LESLVYLSLGSNRGNRVKYLKNAIQELGNILGEIEISRIYETKAMYFQDQAPFLNMVIRGLYMGNPFSLLSLLHDIEKNNGRDRSVEKKNGPRNLDIDILLFGKKKIETKELVIPHPRMNERKFVLVPLLELEPYIEDPVNKKKYWEILVSLPEQGIYYYSTDVFRAFGGS